MTPTRAFLLFLLLSPLPGSAQTDLQRTATTAPQLSELSQQWMNALAAKDRTALENYLAPDFHLGSPGGTHTTARDGFLTKSIEENWRDVHYQNVRVDILGDTAVINSKLDYTINSRLKFPIHSSSPMTEVWSRHNGFWQIDMREVGEYALQTQVHMFCCFLLGAFIVAILWFLFGRRRRVQAVT